MLGNFSYYNPTKLYFRSGGGHPAGYLDLTKEDITEILKESI